MSEPSNSLRTAVEETLGQKVTSWERPALGLSAAERFSVVLADGSRFFVKAAADEDTEIWLKNEHKALTSVRAPFQPEVFAFVEREEDFSVLVTEDLSHAYWPASHAGVTWREGDIECVRETVDEMSRIRPSSDIPILGSEPPKCYWPYFLEDPKQLSDLKLCDVAWLDAFGADLVDAESGLTKAGDHLVHGDVRSDNICLLPDRVVIVDWSNSGRGSPETDLAELLPTLHLEGGPLPYSVMPAGAPWAAWQSGYLASRALSGKLWEGRDQAAPAWLVRVLTRLAKINLVWAANCLGIPSPVDAEHWA